MKNKKKSKKNINLLDVTTRDGSYLVNFQITPKQVGTIVDYLDYVGIRYIEVGHGSGLGATKLGYYSVAQTIDYITEAKTFSKNSKLGVLSPAMSLIIPELEEIAPLIHFVRVGTLPGEVDKAKTVISKAKQLDLEVFVQLTRSSLSTPKQVASEALKAQKMGADVIYLVDTIGNLTPSTLPAYVKYILDKIDVPLGFHGHNNLGLANINSLIAAQEGCEWIDASLLGAGRQAGNTQLETIAILLEQENFQTSINIPLLLDIAESLAAPIFKGYKGISPYDIWSAHLNVDLYPERFYRRLAAELGLSIRDLTIEISKLKNFIALSDEHLKFLTKKFGRNYADILKAVQSDL